MKIKVSAKAPPEISQASTADIAFLLLIFFISTTVFETEFGIPLQLPGMGGVATKVKSDNVLTIKTDASGTITVDETSYSLRQVRDLVKAEIANNENLVVVIETAKDAAYERMIDILDEVKSANATRVSIKKGRG